MKKLIRSALAIISFPLLILTISCNNNNNEEENPFNEEARLAYETLIAVQDSSDFVLAGFESSMDSTAAVEALAQWFRDHDNVEWAKLGSQGITVSYTNGMYGGILLDPGSYDEPAPSTDNQPLERTSESQPSLKNLPTYKKGRVVAAALNEFPNIFMWQIENWEYYLLNNLGLPSVYNLNDEITLDYLRRLQSRQSSIISLNSHGLAWPDDNTIEEVYFITGEAAYNHTTELFYNDMLEKRVILIHYKNSTRYCIAPGFITKYNDFSKDTVLFYGSFCYSFLGNWPQIVEGCASGTYFGVSWKVRSGKCANWAVDLIKNLSDKSFEEPWTVEDWMTRSEISKSYYDEEYQKNVSINYNGNSALTLWKPEYNAEGGIEALAPDKAPILVPGKTCAEYVLRCNVNGQLPAQVFYLWDLGHEAGFNMNQSGNEMTGRWGMPGSYTVKVQVKNEANDELIEEFTTDILIEDPSYLPAVKSYQYFSTVFGSISGPNITLTNGEQTSNNYFNFDTYYFTGQLTWNDSAFSAVHNAPSGYGGRTVTIEGVISPDGRIMQQCFIVQTDIHSDGQFNYESKLEMVNVPIFHHDEWNCWQWFQWDFTGAGVQDYIQNIEFRKYDYQEQEWVTIQSIDWANSNLYGMFDNQ